MREMRNVFKFRPQKPTGKRTRGRLMHGWRDDNIKIYVKEMECKVA
jgi:hypothetical protein